VPLKQLTGRAGDDCRDLNFPFHDEQQIFYIFVEGPVNSSSWPAHSQGAQTCRAAAAEVLPPLDGDGDSAQRAPRGRVGISRPFRVCA
jgi:hypothetical protein